MALSAILPAEERQVTGDCMAPVPIKEQSSDDGAPIPISGAPLPGTAHPCSGATLIPDLSALLSSSLEYCSSMVLLLGDFEVGVGILFLL